MMWAAKLGADGTGRKEKNMRHQHDCELCKPLGEYGDADLYFCDQRLSGPTVIARYSDDGGDYQSGLVFADKIPALGEAKRRAIEAGYMTPNVELTGLAPR